MPNLDITPTRDRPTGPAGDDLVLRVGRWVVAKVWLGCVLSGAYAWGHHFGWPQAVLTGAAVLGAAALAAAMMWLPVWTNHRSTGIRHLDLTARILVRGALATCVVALLISSPAVGTVAGALLIITGERAFRRRPRRSSE